MHGFLFGSGRGSGRRVDVWAVDAACAFSCEAVSHSGAFREKAAKKYNTVELFSWLRRHLSGQDFFRFFIGVVLNSSNAMSPIEPGLIVLHSNRMEVLRDTLVHWLTAYPLNPLEIDIIAVQSNGIAQWLRSTLARGSQGDGPGIAAALDTPMPARLLWSLYRRVLGEANVPPASPLDEEPLTWRLMRLLGNLRDTDVYRPLRQFLADDADLRKRYQLAQRLADLYDQYQVYRADWLADWAEGRDQLRGHAGIQPMEADQCWQSALWRDVLADVGEGAADQGRAGVHEKFIAALRQWPADGSRPNLPRRIVVFGLSSLPRQSLEALIEAARWVQVLVCVHNPCEFHWADIVEGRALLRRLNRSRKYKPGMPPELSEDALHAHVHPLLASWGRQGRDYIALLEELEEESGVDEAAMAGHSDTNHAPVPVRAAPAFVQVEGDSVLSQLQDDIRALRSLNEVREESRIAAAEDKSIHFHIAHSALREVEILHDQLLAAFDEDSSLQPDDVIVMVPDIEQYAPYIDAVFGLHAAADERRIPYFIVDRGAGHVNTVAEAVERLLALPLARMGASEVLDLLDITAVRQRYGLSQDDIGILRDWIESANVRWGLDAGHRESLGLAIEPSLADIHTWTFGLRRMLLGYALGEADEWNGITPHGDVSGLSAGLVGSLSHIVDALRHYARELARPATPAEWARRLRGLLDAFLLPPDDVAAFTIEQLQQELERWLQECEDSGFDEPLTLQVVADRWMSCLQKASMAQRFTSGAVTFATLMPMRAIPFRHVCLLGMNDGDYPRPRAPAHFDLMENDYRPGDRSRRDDDRYLFLEALLSARERFYLSWVGRSVVDNAESPPSVLVAQLRDHLADVWHSESGYDNVLEQLTTEHPLQGFSREYFRSASPESRLFTYSREWRIDRQDARSSDDHSGLSLPHLDRQEPLTFSELSDFLRHPVKEFFQKRLQIHHGEVSAVADIETFMGEGLDSWKLSDALLTAARKHLDAGKNPQQACEAEIKRRRGQGELAFGTAGDFQVDKCMASIEPMFDLYRAYIDAWPEVSDSSLEIRHQAENTPGLSGWLHGLRTQGGREVLWLNIQATALTEGSARHWRDDKLLGHWVPHLAANASGLPMTTVVISPAGEARLAPVEPSRAAAWLNVLLQAWVVGMRRPLPIKAEFARPLLTAIPQSLGPDSDAQEWAELLEQDAVRKAADTCYEKNWAIVGRSHTPYEKRAYPTREALLADGELLRWAVNLYRPLFIALRSKESE